MSMTLEDSYNSPEFAELIRFKLSQAQFNSVSCISLEQVVRVCTELQCCASYDEDRKEAMFSKASEERQQPYAKSFSQVFVRSRTGRGVRFIDTRYDPPKLSHAGATPVTPWENYSTEEKDAYAEATSKLDRAFNSTTVRNLGGRGPKGVGRR